MSNSSPLARCRVSRWTPRAPSPPGSKRRRSSATNARGVAREGGRQRHEPCQGRSDARALGRRACPGAPRASRRRGRRRAPRPRPRRCHSARAGARAAAPHRDRAATSPERAAPPRAAPPRSRSGGRWCGRGSRPLRAGPRRWRIASTIAAASAAGDGKAATTGSGPAARVGRSTFSAPAEPGDEAVREREHLRRRAVVLLEPHDRRVRESDSGRRAGARARRR